MANERLSFDITASDHASRSFKSVGDAALGASGKMDLAAASAKLWDQTVQKQGKAAATSEAAMKSHAKAAGLLADAENVLAGKATVTTKLMADQGRELGKTAKSTEDLAASAAGAAPSLGSMLTPMTGLVGAGVALSPVIATVGLGLGGLAVGAAGTIAPLLKAAQATGGLQANMSKLDPEQRAAAQSLLTLQGTYRGFEKALAPAVLADFNSAVGLAGHLLKDLQPVSQATGKALGGVLGQIDAEFASQRWQQFFGFMARTAGPDLKLLTASFVNLTDTLPPLLEALQPTATELLQITAGATKLIDVSAQLNQRLDVTGAAAQKSGGFLGVLAGAAGRAVGQIVPGVPAAQRLAGWLGKLGDSSKAAVPQQDAVTNAAAAQTAAINKLNAAMTINIAKILTLEGDEVSWKQAQQAATAAVNANHHALDGNSASALAARAAIISATSAVIKFADDSNTSTGALHRGSDALQNQITWLEKHAGKSRIAAEEIKALREEEAKIKREIDQRIKVTGSGRFSVAGSGLPGGIGHRTGAAGGRVPGFGGGDVHPYLLEGGEAIVPKHLTPAVAPFLKAQGVPGFAAGGIVPDYSGGIPGLGPWALGNTRAVLQGLDRAVASALNRELQSISSFGAAGPGGGAPSANAALARHMFPGENFAAWNYVAMRESGWNQFALNPSSGAYGIAQALPPTKYPFAGQAAGGSNPAAQISWMEGYMRSRYGGAAGAAAHERALNWYGNGLDAIFRRPTLIGVGERGPEQVHVGRPGSSGAQHMVLEVRARHGATDLDRAIVAIIQKHVIVHGGGDVQAALGQKA